MPRLQLPVFEEKGRSYVSEYIPSASHFIKNYLYSVRLSFLLRFRRPIYYYHLRYLLNPIFRKQCDLLFISHVLIDHQRPIDKTEQRHFVKIYSKYTQELQYFMPIVVAYNDKLLREWSVYMQAYADMWLIPMFPEIKLYFHGDNQTDFSDFLDRHYKTYKDANKRFRAKTAAKYRKLSKQTNIQGNRVMSKTTITGKVYELAFELLEEHPEGIRWKDLLELIKQSDPTLHPKTVNGCVWKMPEKFPESVYKPKRGVFRLLKFKE